MKLSAQISNTRRWLVQEYDIREEYVKAFIEMYDKAIEMEQQVKNLNLHIVSGSACRCEKCTGLKSAESFYED